MIAPNVAVTVVLVATVVVADAREGVFDFVAVAEAVEIILTSVAIVVLGVDAAVVDIAFGEAQVVVAADAVVAVVVV